MARGDFPLWTVPLGVGVVLLITTVVAMWLWLRQHRLRCDIEARLAERSAFETLLLHSTDEGLFVTDENHIIEGTNPNAASILGTTQELLAGRSMYDFVYAAHETDRTLGEDLADSGRREEIHARRSDGSTVPLMAAVRRYIIDGRDKHLWLLRDISANKDLEASVLDNIEKLLIITEAAQDAIVMTDAEGTIKFFNVATQAIFGREPENLFDLPLWALFKDCSETSVLRELFQKMEVKPGLIARGETLDLPAIRGEDQEFIAQISFSATQATSGWHAISIIRDVTENRRFAEALKHSEAQFRAIFNSAAAGIFLLDGQGAFVRANMRWGEMSLWREDSFQTIRFEQLVDGELRKGCRENLKALIEGEIKLYRFETRLARRDGTLFWGDVSFTPIQGNQKGAELMLGVVVDISERKRAEEARQLMALAVEQSPEAIVVTGTDGRIQYINPTYEKITGLAEEEAIGAVEIHFKRDCSETMSLGPMHRAMSMGKIWSGSFTNQRKDGIYYDEEATFAPMLDSAGRLSHYVGVIRDVTQERQLETKLRQAQKLEAVGQLAAGIAHEINTPIMYVGENLHFFKEGYQGIGELLECYEGLVENISHDGAHRIQIAKIEMVSHRIDLPFLREELPTAIDQSLGGVKRIAEIVQSMKEFSHPGGSRKMETDLNRSIQSTLTVARNAWKYVADLHSEFDESLPPVACFPGELNQVILNLVVNASQAIAEVRGDHPLEKGVITVQTIHEPPFAVIRVADNGPGISPEIRSRIFDPFFTTKDVGKGSGQGLAISHAVIVEKHGGSIDFETEIGEGTTFTIKLPMDNSSVTAVLDVVTGVEE